MPSASLRASSHLVLEETSAEDNALLRPSVSPSSHMGGGSFQGASPVLHPLGILPQGFLPSNRANCSFPVPLPHTCIGESQDPQNPLLSQEYLDLGLSGPD